MPTEREELESLAPDEYRDSRAEKTMRRVHNRAFHGGSSFNSKGNRFVPKKCGRRGK